MPDLHVLWEQRFRAYAPEVPRAAHAPRALCRHLSTQQWPFCATRRARLPQYNTLQLLLMPCAFTDHGRNFRGAIYDGTRVLNAQHATATPAFARGPMVRLETVAVALTPYGHLTDAHFYASTAPWVLQLLAVLPAKVRLLLLLRVRILYAARYVVFVVVDPLVDALLLRRRGAARTAQVPIIAALSDRLRILYRHVGVPIERLVTVPRGGVIYAQVTRARGVVLV